MSEWIASKELINGKPCVCHRYNKADKQIFGHNGTITETGPGLYKAVVTNHRIYNRLALEFGIMYRAKPGDEVPLSFKQSDFKRVHRSMRVPADLGVQVGVANVSFRGPLNASTEASEAL
jgi:hypothetical protein